MDHLLILCTGNATRSVIAGAVLRHHLPDIEVSTAGTLSIDGLAMSWRTRAGFESVGLPVPQHRSRQARAEDIEQATLVIGLAPEHVAWVRREHPDAAAGVDDLLPGRQLDPGEVEAFTACAREVVDQVDELADRLRPR